MSMRSKEAGALREAHDNYGAVWPQENAYLIDFKMTNIQNGLYWSVSLGKIEPWHLIPFFWTAWSHDSQFLPMPFISFAGM